MAARNGILPIMALATVALIWIGAYLIASIPFGVVVARLRGVDIRKAGSGNIGATNVGRVLGRKWGLLVLLLDAMKGALPMFATGWAAAHATIPDWGPATPNLMRLGTGIACVIGSVAPIYLGFRGGKAVATSLGLLLAAPHLTVAAMIAFGGWLLVRFTSGYVSLASVVAALLLPIATWAMGHFRGWPLREEYPLLILTGAIALIVIVRHRGNLARLAAGTEPRAGADRKP